MKRIAALIVCHPERVINLISGTAMTVLFLCMIALSMHWLIAIAFVSFMGILCWLMLWMSLEKLRGCLEQLGECQGYDCVPNVLSKNNS